MQLHDVNARGFGSDNASGVHPEILAALAQANGGHQSAYGADAYTERLQEVIGQHFGSQALAFPVFNGTGANVLALQACVPRWGAVVTTEAAHIHRSEGAAPERVGGLKLLTVPTSDGKLTPELVDREAWGWGDEHRAQPLVVSITQVTELGTVYTVDEIRALAAHAHERGMLLHVDGARLANAAVALGVGFAEFTTDVGVDIVSLGATKNGAMGAEAVLVLSDRVPDGITYLRKLNMQLASKMRFISAQLVAMFEGDLWHRSAHHANEMAHRLRAALAELPGVEFTQPTDANGVFVRLPEGVGDKARARYPFHDWDAAHREARLMCSFDTTAEDVDQFAELIRAEVVT